MVVLDSAHGGRVSGRAALRHHNGYGDGSGQAGHGRMARAPVAPDSPDMASHARWARWRTCRNQCDGVYAQLVAAHFGDRISATGAVETEAATLAARIDAQTHAVADVDTRLAQIDGAIAEMTKRARTNGALDAINSQRKARAELVAQRQREADVLTGLKTEQAAAAAKARQVEVEAAPIMYVAQLLGGTTEQAPDTVDGALL